MRIFRATCAATIVVCACLLVHALAVQPYRSNILKKRVKQEFDALYASTGARNPSFEALRQARENVADLRSAMRYVPTDVDLHLELAAYYRILGQLDEQIAIYGHLLKFHRRPEIFHNLGSAEFDAGRLQRAVESLSFAVAFDHLYIHSVPDGLKEEVTGRAEQLRRDLAAKLTPR